MKILSVEQMRQVEQSAAKLGLPASVLMGNAGKAVAEEVRRLLGNIDRQAILILIGPGNNGGDGLVAARYLHDWGAKVSLYLPGKRAPDTNLELVRQRNIVCVDAIDDGNLNRLEELLSSAAAVVDALFGTGANRPLGGAFVSTLERVTKAKEQRPGIRLIALDLPSGLNADTGLVDPACLYIDNTITLGFAKPGLFNASGAGRVGRLSIVDIGLPSSLADAVTTELLDDTWVRSVLPKRPLTANKGTFGRVLVVAGSINYIGAAYLACSGALRVGAGLVTLATPTSIQPVLAARLTEVTYLLLPESAPGIISPQAAGLIQQEINNYNVLLVGCGLGQSQSVVSFVTSALFGLKPASTRLVLDADVLNIMARTPQWWQQLTDNAILTPHPGEMARLAGLSVDEVQADRAGIAKKLALEWHKTIVLKGAYTVIATPEGRVKISPLANPGLASAGTGDVLSGVIAGLLAQGMSLFDAAAAGVYLHGQAGEIVRQQLGDAGMIATDLLPVLPLAMKRLKENLGDEQVQ